MKTSSTKHSNVEKKGFFLPLDHVNAFLENEFLVSEMVGIREGESSSFLKKMWEQSALKISQGIFNIPAMPFRSIGNVSTIDQLNGFSESGKRSSLICSDSLLSDINLHLQEGYAFVTAIWLQKSSPKNIQGGIRLFARTPQQTADLLNIAHWLSEAALLPVLMFFHQDEMNISFPEIELLAPESLKAYLGYPEDIIQTPTAFQESLFGKTRKRIPLLTREDRKSLDKRLFLDVPVLFQKAAEAFAGISGRRYAFWELEGKPDSDILVIATGEHFNFLAGYLSSLNKELTSPITILHPTLLHPFPENEYLKLLIGKKAVIVLTPDVSGEMDPLFQEIQETFRKTLINERYHKLGKPYPYPESAHITPENIPDLRTVTAPLSGFDIAEFKHLIQEIQTGESPSFHFVLNPSPAADTTSDRSKSEKVISILYRSREPYWSARRIARLLKHSAGIYYHMTTPAEASPVTLHLSTGKFLPLKKGIADFLISTRYDLGNLPAALKLLKEKGVLLLEGNPKIPGESWSQLPGTVRNTISEKKLHLYFVNFESPESETAVTLRMAEEKIEAAILGAILKILGSEFPKMVKPEKLQAALKSFTANNEPGFAQAISSGYESCAKVDYSFLQFDEIPPAADTDEPLFRIEPLPEAKESLSEFADILRLLMNFYYEARGFKSPFTAEGVESLMPVHFYQFRNMELARHDFPILLMEDEGNLAVRPLKNILDEIVESSALEGDEKARFQQTLWMMEVYLKRLLGNKSGLLFSELWRSAGESLLQEFSQDKEKQAQYQKDLQQAEALLNFNGRMYNCSDRALTHALYHQSMRIWQEKVADFREELDQLIVRLNDILVSDYQKKPEAKTPSKLQKSVGSGYAEEIDFKEFSELLEETPIFGEPLEDKRHRRIEETLHTLKKLKGLFYPEAVGAGESFIEQRWNSLISLDSRNSNCASSLAHFEAQLHSLTNFFRAVRIAKLEVENRYREDRHDAFFAEFGPENLSLEEVALFPPFPIRIAYRTHNEKTAQTLLSLMATRLPLKVLLIIDDLCGGVPAPGGIGCSGDWFNFIAQMLLTLNDVFVLQTTASNFSRWMKGFEEGLKYNGPALFFIYNGDLKNFTIPQSYLISAAANESRAFPGFQFNPDAGDNWSERFSLEGNSELDRDWPSLEMVVSENGETEPRSFNFPFTFVDFLAIDRRFSGYFMMVPRRFWHTNMVYLPEFLQIDSAETTYKIPYIWMVDDQGVLHRVVVAREVIEATRKALSNWRLLQELSGIKSPLVQKLLKAELEKFENQKQQELSELEQKYQQELDKAVDEVAKQIVSNIAAGLLNEGAMPAAVPSAPPVSAPTPTAEPASQAPVSESEAETEAAPEVVEEEEEEISFDEPYIETPRCTSCNECINRNPQMFAYNENKQAYIKDPYAGTYRDLVESAEKCPVRIIHPGKPKNPDEPGLEELLERAKPFL